MRNTFLDLRTARDIDAVVTKILRGLGNPEPPPVRPEKPHGPDYSLTLHDGDGERLWVLTTLIPFVKARDPERGFASSMTTSIEVSASAFMTM